MRSTDRPIYHPLAPDNYRIDVGIVEKVAARSSLGMIPLINGGRWRHAASGDISHLRPKVDLDQIAAEGTCFRRRAKSARPTYHDATIQASFETSQRRGLGT